MHTYLLWRVWKYSTHAFHKKEKTKTQFVCLCGAHCLIFTLFADNRFDFTSLLLASKSSQSPLNLSTPRDYLPQCIKGRFRLFRTCAVQIVHNSPAHPFYFLFASAGCVKGRVGLIEESSSGTWSSRVRLHPPPPLELQTLPAPAQLHSSVGSMDSDEVPSTRRTKSLLSPLCFESKDTKTAQPPPFTLPLTPFVAFVIAPSQLSTRVVEDGWSRLGSSRLGGHGAAGVLDLLPPSWKQRRSDDSLSVAAC